MEARLTFGVGDAGTGTREDRAERSPRSESRVCTLWEGNGGEEEAGNTGERNMDLIGLWINTFLFVSEEGRRGERGGNISDEREWEVGGKVGMLETPVLVTAEKIK